MSAKILSVVVKTAPVVALLLLGVVALPDNAEAGVTATITGSVLTKQITYGAAGSVSEILLIVNTWDQNYWGVRCTRAESNLGKCSPIQQGDGISATGVLVYGGYIGCGNLSPSSVVVLSGQ